MSYNSNDPRRFSIRIEDAIKNGEVFYFDQDAIYEGRSGGIKCPKCKKWIKSPRKRKNIIETWLHDCEKCEIKDPFRKMWHSFNTGCNEYERELHNEWLREVRQLAGDLHYIGDTTSKITKLNNLLQKIPFFGY